MSQLAVWQLKYENDKIYYYVTEYPWPAHAVKDPTQECIDLGRKCVCVWIRYIFGTILCETKNKITLDAPTNDCVRPRNHEVIVLGL